MRLTVQVKLITDPDTSAILIDTLYASNEACNYISQIAWESRVFSQFKLHKRVYDAVRDTFKLPSQNVIRCNSKVADAYKLDKKTKRTFKRDGAVAFDNRNLRWYKDIQKVSVTTRQGRLTLPYLCGERQKELLKHQQGETDLCLIDGNWYLSTTCEISEAHQILPEEALGVDLGIVQIATDSEGHQYSGEQIQQVRTKVQKHRSSLQSKGTKSAKRRLRKKSRKVSRFIKDVNHCIAKKIVKTAFASCKAIVFELLKGIRDRVSVKNTKQLRKSLGNWSFHQLQQFVCYKAQIVGIPFLFVDPAYTSQTCSNCGHCERANRRSQSEFQCVQCGFQTNADFNAALNLKARVDLSTCLLSQQEAHALC